jgi:hypothetical protein
LTRRVVRIEDISNDYKIFVGKLGGKKNLEGAGIDGRIVLVGILRNRMRCFGPYSSGSGKGTVAGSYDSSNELSSSIKHTEFLEKNSHYILLKKKLFSNAAVTFMSLKS